MLSIPDMALLGAAALLLFGPEQLPRVARKAGNVMREIQNTSSAFIREMERAADLADAPPRPSVYDPVTPYEPPAPDPAPYDVLHEPVEPPPYEPADPPPYEPADGVHEPGHAAPAHDAAGPHDGAPHDAAAHDSVMHAFSAHQPAADEPAPEAAGVGGGAAEPPEPAGLHVPEATPERDHTPHV